MEEEHEEWSWQVLARISPEEIGFYVFGEEEKEFLEEEIDRINRELDNTVGVPDNS